MTVPSIDIDGLPATRAAVARAVDRACTDIGFFTIVGHRVPESLCRRMMEVSRAFFDLPAAEKQAVRRPRPEQSRGYIAVGDENLSRSRGDVTTTDLKEFFAIGPVDAPDDEYHRRPEAYPSFAPNLWPARPVELRAVWTEYYRAMEGLAARVMRIFAVALDLDERFFDDKSDRHISGIRANHYPEQVEAPRPGQIRAGAHTDYGALTILLPDDVPGLQVLSRHAEWIDVTPPPGAFVCNIGDLMQHWTNDRWTSTMHRVVNPSREAAAGNRRLSIPFFHQPNYDALIECLPSCCGPDNPPRYEPVTSGQHRLTKFLRGVGASAPFPLPSVERAGVRGFSR
ncbi:MAG TPA: 2-oxoglutarate and iron-dependent oxygenase domain-containing protein [Methylomirabilota bacterium]|nr:2-oxoglutarate and iron-dependent oxygenase domain-containing protein [Methylomirabilota bacterium]